VQIFALSPLELLLASALLGLVIGSFLNVVAFRVPIMMQQEWRRHCAELDEEGPSPPPRVDPERFNLWWPPSSCPACGHRIRGWHNIPVVSYLWLRGRCADCGARVSPRYPVVEAAVALASLAVAWVFGPTWQTAVALPFTWCLIALTLIDLDHQLLPDSLTLPLLWAGLLVSLAAFAGGEPPFAGLRDSVIGAAAGYLSLWSVYQLFKLLTGKEGMGHGDFKLLAALGAWLGWQLLPLVIVLSAAVGSVAGIVMIAVRGRSGGTAIPFGPYLAAAGWIALLWGPGILAWYRHLMMP
jgi:leader peptidase (prepilin peptidase)/N-methyltransferase